MFRSELIRFIAELISEVTTSIDKSESSHAHYYELGKLAAAHSLLKFIKDN